MASEDSSTDVCVCGHAQTSHHWHAAQGEACIGNRNLCSCRMFLPPLEPKRPDLRCTCGCLRRQHMGKPEGCQKHAFHGFVCDHTRCGWKPREEPECNEVRLYGKHCFDHGTGHCCACHVKEPEPGRCTRQHPETGARCEKRNDLFHMEHVYGGQVWDDRDDEPPLTPEEEEQAPEDGALAKFERDVLDGKVGGPLPPPEGPEYDKCMCGAVRAKHVNAEGACYGEDCDCFQFRAKQDDPPPPQPERRPPFLVAYSVSGHLFEVALSGDATVRAVDGALVIQHHLGPVAGIVSVLPVINKES